MAKLTLALTTALVASTSAFAPSSSAKSATTLSATGFEEVGGKAWDPLSLGQLEDANDTFPNMFPKSQFLQEAEIKHGRMSMLAWTGVWATHVVSQENRMGELVEVPFSNLMGSYIGTTPLNCPHIKCSPPLPTFNPHQFAAF